MSYETSFRAIFPYYANEWINRQRAFDVFFDELKARQHFPEQNGRTVLTDHGCGTGENLALLTRSILPKAHRLRIRAVDQNRQLALETGSRLAPLNLDASVSEGDGLATDPNALRNTLKLEPGENISVAMIEHVLYPIINDKNRLEKVIGTVSSMIHPNGVLVSTLSNGSDADEVRGNQRDLRSSGAEEPAHKFSNAAKALGMRIFEIPIRAKLVDPGISEKEWDDIGRGRAKPGSPLEEKISTAIRLLEFSVAPYDAMTKQGILQSSAQKFSQKIKKGFSIDSIIQILASPHSTTDFVETVENAAAHASKQCSAGGTSHITIDAIEDVASYRPA
jgi:hypothetical protein